MDFEFSILNSMNVFNSFKRSRFFLWINIVGLTIGLAASIMLILFVVNELHYDKHFKNNERIVRLQTVVTQEGNKIYYPINLGKAYSEVPAKVPAIEATASIYNVYGIELIDQNQIRYSDVQTFLTEPEFFKVFKMRFYAGSEEAALATPNSIVITKPYADIIFGGSEEAMNQSLSYNGSELVVSGVVEPLPKNSHFSFDVLCSSKIWGDIYSQFGGLEFHIYYLIRENASLEDTRKAIELEYKAQLTPWAERVGDKDATGLTEMLSDVYLKSKAVFSLGTTSSMQFILILSLLAILILILAISNFVNLFISQGEMRMHEIGIRKSNGAKISDIVRLFFSEISVIVLIAFVLGLLCSVICLPHFAELIGKDIDPNELVTFPFILSIILLFIVTVVLSTFYPAIYLSRFSPLEILGNRVFLSKRKLTGVIIVFQSIISIVLLSVILMLYKQSHYLKSIPLNYNPHQVAYISGSQTVNQSYNTVEQEFLKYPEVLAVAGSSHVFGAGPSGQVIATWEDQEKPYRINEYRVLTGFPELMEMELVEGRFWNEHDPDSICMLVLNEAAVKMLGGESPIGKTYAYWGPSRVIGVVKDFYYDSPVLDVAPMALNRIFAPSIINIRFAENVSRLKAQEIINSVVLQIDPGGAPIVGWSIDLYRDKFDELDRITRIILIASILSFFIAMMGMLAVHLYSTLRRTKEIALRRINGAERSSVFVTLTKEVFLWIAIATVIAVPIAYFLISKLMENFTNHASVSWTVFVLAILIQCLLALLTTSGVTLWALSRNPANALKTE